MRNREVEALHKSQVLWVVSRRTSSGDEQDLRSGCVFGRCHFLSPKSGLRRAHNYEVGTTYGTLVPCGRGGLDKRPCQLNYPSEVMLFSLIFKGWLVGLDADFFTKALTKEAFAGTATL